MEVGPSHSSPSSACHVFFFPNMLPFISRSLSLVVVAPARPLLRAHLFAHLRFSFVAVLSG
jgi:hypothetical protein